MYHAVFINTASIMRENEDLQMSAIKASLNNIGDWTFYLDIIELLTFLFVGGFVCLYE
jgi:hypothetical protein